MAQLPPTGKITPSQPLVYRLCSLSSASKNRYPDNRITKFIHHLPEAIFLDRTKVYVIRLQSVCLSNKRRPEWQAPPHIRLHLAQLQANSFSAPDRVRCLAQFVLPDRARTHHSDSRESRLDWFELDNSTPLVLDRTISSLNELSFEFTDNHNKELQLAEDGHPTVVNCVIEEMTTLNRFTVTMNPSLSRDQYPSNSDVNFCVSFGSAPITIGPDWQVALHSVIVPAGIRVLGEYFEYRAVLNIGRTMIRRFKNTGQSAKEMIDRLMVDVVSHDIYVQRVDHGHYSVQFAADHERTSRSANALHFNPSLCKLFNMHPYKPAGGYSFFPTSSPSEKIFPFGMTFNPERVIHADEQLVLYADIVQSSIFGDDRAQLVDILSTVRLGMLDQGPSIDTLYSVPRPTYRPVAKTLIKDIRVRITDIHGQLAEFEYGNASDEMQFIFIFQK